jgi:hypothetical protein
MGTVTAVMPVVELDAVNIPPAQMEVVEIHRMSSSMLNGLLVMLAVSVTAGLAMMVTGVPALNRSEITVVPGAAAVVTVPQTLTRIILPIRVQEAGRTAVPTPVPRILVMAVAAPLVPVAVWVKITPVAICLMPF